MSEQRDRWICVPESLSPPHIPLRVSTHMDDPRRQWWAGWGQWPQVLASDEHLPFCRIESLFRTMESSPSGPQPTQSNPPETFPQRSMEPADITVLVLYFLFVLAVGLWVSQSREWEGKKPAQGQKVIWTLQWTKNALNVDCVSRKC